MTVTEIEIPVPPRPRADTLRAVLDFSIPILLTFVIVSLVLFRVDVTHRFQQTAHSVQATACGAVRDSNADLDAFLAAQALRVKDPGFQQFVDDLKADHKVTYSRCLAARQR